MFQWSPCLLVLALTTISISACATTSEETECKSMIHEPAEDLFLEEIHGDRALQWVKDHNARSLDRLQSDPRFEPIKSQTLKILNSPDKLLQVTFREDYAYNFWRDAKNQRGLWRRTKIKDFLKKKPKWETLIDFDKLAETEKENWVYGGVVAFKNRALVSLSRGGKDAKVVREFDTETKQFITDGFSLPESKSRLAWIDEDTIFVAPAIDADDLTDSGYPRKVFVLKRGQSLEQGTLVFEGDKSNVSVGGSTVRDEESGPAKHRLVYRSLDFFNNEYYLLRNGQTLKLPVPTTAEPSFDEDSLYVELKEEWSRGDATYTAGSLLRFNLEDLLADGNAPAELLFKPSHEKILSSFFVHRGRRFLLLSEHVTLHLYELIGDKLKPIQIADNASIGLSSYSKSQNLLIVSAEGFLKPETRFVFDLTKNTISEFDQQPARFDATPYEVNQHFATSPDGTRVPYYVVGKKNSSRGPRPAIIHAYGGFEVSQRPHYSASIELGWLKNDGVWVLANIRGGGEYGPDWHRAALKEKRQKAFDDFHAVAEDLIQRKITTAQQLGIVGGSNGGLLTGVAFTQRPDLYEAAAVQVPLLDMMRYHLLLAGASWMGEYGNPEDPVIREAILKYSPYQNVKADVNYPEVFFMTSTADDRVHPGHARRMAAKMERQGHPFLYYENIEGGHGGAANYEQTALWVALEYVYFQQKLMDKK